MSEIYVNVYTQPGCMRCRTLMRALDRAEVAYHAIDVSQDTAAHDRLVAEKLIQLPVSEIVRVDADGEHETVTTTTEFRPAAIIAKVEALQTES